MCNKAFLQLPKSKYHTLIHLKSLLIAFMASGLVTSGLKAAYNSKPEVTCKIKNKRPGSLFDVLYNNNTLFKLTITLLIKRLLFALSSSVIILKKIKYNVILL